MNQYNAPPQDPRDETRRPRYSREERRARRRRRKQLHYLRILSVVLLFVLIVAAASSFIRWEAPAPAPSAQSPEEPLEPAASISTPIIEEPPEPIYAIHPTPDTVQIDPAFPSQYAILVDLESGAILAERDPEVIINPASMTKILTLLVAVENLPDWEGTFTMTREVADYCFSNKCSVVGYEVGEVVPIRELFYGCILNSGADACLGLVEVITGSHEAFVELMNDKLEELGLSDTAHFTNCVGLYDQDHSCTVRDLALILKAALENETCREVLFTPVYTSQPTPEHPEGQVLSNLFLRRIQKQDTGSVQVLCAKTGYVSESGFCAASYGETESGRGFLCVTGKSTSTWQSIYDHAALYRTHCSEDPLPTT